MADEKILIEIEVDNDAAIRLYKEKLGFKILSREDHEYGKNEHRYEMELEFS